MKIFVWLRSNGWRWQSEDNSMSGFGILLKEDAIADAEHHCRTIDGLEVIIGPPPEFQHEARA